MSAVRFSGVVPAPAQAGWPEPVSFDIEEGRFALFATTPGIGLSLVRLIVGLRQPADGVVEVLGFRPGTLSRRATQRFRRRLGVGFDEPSGLVSNLTLRMNLVVPLLYSGRADANEAHDRAGAIIDRCDLTRWADLRPADVPPEVRQEAVLARAVVGDPELLILEEPTAGLREKRAAWLLSLCRERAGTMVVTTAEREGVHFEVADTILLLDNSGIQITSHEVGVV